LHSLAYTSLGFDLWYWRLWQLNLLCKLQLILKLNSITFASVTVRDP